MKYIKLFENFDNSYDNIKKEFEMDFKKYQKDREILSYSPEGIKKKFLEEIEKENPDMDYILRVIELGAIDVRKTFYEEIKKATPNLQLIKEIIKMGIINPKGIRIEDWDENEVPLLIYALENDDNEFAEILLKAGVDENEYNHINNTPLHIAVQNRNLEQVKLLVRYDADIELTNDDEETPLHLSVKDDKNLPITKYLIENEANIEAETWPNEETPLHIAVGYYRKGSIETIKYLIEMGAELESKNSLDKTPFLIAANNQNLDALKLLIEHDVNTNAVDKYLNNALHLCFMFTSTPEILLPILELLFSLRVDVNAKNVVGKTPLHFAVQYNYYKYIEFLLENGADPTIKSIDGKTPWDLATDSIQDRVPQLKP